MANYKYLDLERPEIDYNNCQNGRLDIKQYELVLVYLSNANRQLNGWADLPKLRDRFDALQQEALEVFLSLSEEDSRRATSRLANCGIDLMII